MQSKCLMKEKVAATAKTGHLAKERACTASCLVGLPSWSESSTTSSDFDHPLNTDAYTDFDAYYCRFGDDKGKGKGKKW